MDKKLINDVSFKHLHAASSVQLENDIFDIQRGESVTSVKVVGYGHATKGFFSVLLEVTHEYEAFVEA